MINDTPVYKLTIQKVSFEEPDKTGVIHTSAVGTINGYPVTLHCTSKQKLTADQVKNAFQHSSVEMQKTSKVSRDSNEKITKTTLKAERENVRLEFTLPEELSRGFKLMQASDQKQTFAKRYDEQEVLKTLELFQRTMTNLRSKVMFEGEHVPLAVAQRRFLVNQDVIDIIKRLKIDTKRHTENILRENSREKVGRITDLIKNSNHIFTPDEAHQTVALLKNAASRGVYLLVPPSEKGSPLSLQRACENLVNNQIIQGLLETDENLQSELKALLQENEKVQNTFLDLIESSRTVLSELLDLSSLEEMTVFQKENRHLLGYRETLNDIIDQTINARDPKFLLRIAALYIEPDPADRKKVVEAISKALQGYGVDPKSIIEEKEGPTLNFRENFERDFQTWNPRIFSFKDIYIEELQNHPWLPFATEEWRLQTLRSIRNFLVDNPQFTKELPRIGQLVRLLDQIAKTSKDANVVSQTNALHSHLKKFLPDAQEASIEVTEKKPEPLVLVDINVNGKDLKISKEDLLNAGFFKTAYSANMKEAQSNKFTLPNEPMLEEFVKFLRTGQIELTHDNVSSLAWIANKYDAPALAKRCEEWLIKGVENLEPLQFALELAQQCRFPKLESEIMKRVVDEYNFSGKLPVPGTSIRQVDLSRLIKDGAIDFPLMLLLMKQCPNVTQLEMAWLSGHHLHALRPYMNNVTSLIFGSGMENGGSGLSCLQGLRLKELYFKTTISADDSDASVLKTMPLIKLRFGGYRTTPQAYKNLPKTLEELTILQSLDNETLESFKGTGLKKLTLYSVRDITQQTLKNLRDSGIEVIYA